MPVETVQDRGGEARSSFAKLLASDPALAKRCEKVVQALREAARKDVEDGERAQRLTKDDFAIIINARADGVLCDED